MAAPRDADCEFWPPEVRCSREALWKMRQVAVATITKKNSIGLKLSRTLERIEAGLAPADEGQVRKEIARLEGLKALADAEVDRHKTLCLRAEMDFRVQLREHRLLQVPEDRRKEARALLLEEDQALRSVRAKPPSEVVVPVFVRYQDLSTQIKKAREQGDHEFADTLLPQFETVQAERDNLIAQSRARLEGEGQIWTDYKARFNALLESQPKP